MLYQKRMVGHVAECLPVTKAACRPFMHVRGPLGALRCVYPDLQYNHLQLVSPGRRTFTWCSDCTPRPRISTLNCTMQTLSLKCGLISQAAFAWLPLISGSVTLQVSKARVLHDSSLFHRFLCFRSSPIHPQLSACRPIRRHGFLCCREDGVRCCFQRS